jgi:outer membrane biosynthesis protein TonB
VPEGPDADHPIGRENPKEAEKDRQTIVEGPDRGEGRGPGAPGSGEGNPAETGEEATIAHGDLVPPPGTAGAVSPPPGSESSAGRSATAGNEHPGSGGGTRSTPNLKPGTEYKFQFNNPGWLKDRAYGTMSFDTQGFPWGDYARKLYVAIRNRWLERIPLAARENMAGYTCQHFVIARDGTVTAIDVLHPSTIPPFTKAATDAINAASRVPPLPEDFPKDSEGVTYCFYYNMYPGEGE